MSEHRCAGCSYWDPFEEKPAWGHCRVPSAVKVGGARPVTFKRDWCSGFKKDWRKT